MEIRQKPFHIPSNSLMCLEYKLASNEKPIFSYITERNKFLQYKLNCTLPPAHVSREEPSLKLPLKMNYTEDELFKLNQKRAPDQELPPPPRTNEYNHLSETMEEEIDKTIIMLNKDTDHKTKGQVIKKLLNYVKKNKMDELRMTSFKMKLSNQTKRDYTDISDWLEYEGVKNRMESLLSSIGKEIYKLIDIMNENHLTFEVLITDPKSKLVRQTIASKINEYMRNSRDEE